MKKVCGVKRCGLLHGMVGYSLIEVVIAGAILMITIAAAVAMSLSVVTQRETNIRIAHALSYQEQAARLFQLGLATNTILAILPPDEAVTSLLFRNHTITTIGNIAGMERVECEMIFHPNPATVAASEGTWVAGDSSAIQTNTVVVIRPTIR